MSADARLEGLKLPCVLTLVAALLAVPSGAEANATLDFRPSDTVVITADAEPLELAVGSTRRLSFVPPGARDRFDVSSARGFTNRTGTRCTDTSTPPEGTDSTCPPPGATEVTASPGADSIRVSCFLLQGGLRARLGDGDDEVWSGCPATIDLGPGNDAGHCSRDEPATTCSTGDRRGARRSIRRAPTELPAALPSRCRWRRAAETPAADDARSSRRARTSGACVGPRPDAGGRRRQASGAGAVGPGVPGVALGVLGEGSRDP
jgi:hypothetical protein